MAVGYLACDWDASKVCTEDRGKRFIFATDNFQRESGKYVGIGFFDGEAFGVFDEDKGGYLNSLELWNFFKDEVVHGDISHFKDLEEDYVEFIDVVGDFSEALDVIDFDDDTLNEIQNKFKDVADRYWE